VYQTVGGSFQSLSPHLQQHLPSQMGDGASVTLEDLDALDEESDRDIDILGSLISSGVL
jgi:hypothetical protein